MLGRIFERLGRTSKKLGRMFARETRGRVFEGVDFADQSSPKARPRV